MLRWLVKTAVVLGFSEGGSRRFMETPTGVAVPDVTTAKSVRNGVVPDHVRGGAAKVRNSRYVWGTGNATVSPTGPDLLQLKGSQCDGSEPWATSTVDSHTDRQARETRLPEKRDAAASAPRISVTSDQNWGPEPFTGERELLAIHVGGGVRRSRHPGNRDIAHSVRADPGHLLKCVLSAQNC